MDNSILSLSFVGTYSEAGIALAKLKAIAEENQVGSSSDNDCLRPVDVPSHGDGIVTFRWQFLGSAEVLIKFLSIIKE